MMKFADYIIIACLFSVAVGSSCSKSAPPHEQLAALEESTGDPSPELIETFRKILDDLSYKCPSQSVDEIKGNIIQGQEIRKRVVGKSLRLLEVAQLIDASIPDGSEVEKCDKMDTSLL